MNAEFNARILKWALQEFRVDVDDDLKLLRSIMSPNANNAVAIMERIAVEERHIFASALTKSGFDSQVQKMSGVALTEHEKAYIREYREMAFKLRAMNPRVDRRLLKRRIDEELSSVFDRSGVYERSPTQNVYLVKHAEWEVYTLVDAYGPFMHFCYHHVVTSANKMVELASQVSVCSWRGISSTDEWMLEEEEETNTAVQSLGDCIRIFLAAIPELLEGLTIEQSK